MINILVCDDDPNFVNKIREKITNLSAYSRKYMDITCITNANELTDEVVSKCDILFLDIDLGEKNGIELARRIREKNRKIILIFVTNFKEFAPEGYEVDAFRYLAKSDLEEKLDIYFTDALSLCRQHQRKLEIFCDGEIHLIPIRSLVYIESQGREQCIHLCGYFRDALSTRLTMSQLEKLLFPQGFLRIHKGFIVNMAYLQSFKSTGALLSTGEKVPVGARRYRANKQKFVMWQAQQIW